MGTKQCEYCSEEILETAKKCKHCGKKFDNEWYPKLSFMIGGMIMALTFLGYKWTSTSTQIGIGLSAIGTILGIIAINKKCEEIVLAYIGLLASALSLMSFIMFF